jgi:hypothetical protein
MSDIIEKTILASNHMMEYKIAKTQSEKVYHLKEYLKINPNDHHTKRLLKQEEKNAIGKI